VTSEEIRDKDVLVVGGGDTATEYCQFLVQEENRVVFSYRGAALTRPNPINRESVMALERQRELRMLLGSSITGLEAAGDRVRPLFAEPSPGAPLEFHRVVYALGGTTPESFLKSVGIEFEGAEPRLTESFGTSVPTLSRWRPDGRQARRLDHPRLQHRRRGDAPDLPGPRHLRRRRARGR
jgi:thioredoxin reductase (NADPH)